MGSKRAHFTCLCTPNGLGSFLEKHFFDPFLTHFLVAKQPIFKAFCDFEGAKMGCMGPKWAHFTCLVIPNGLGSFLKKHIFDKRALKMGQFGTTNGSKMGQNHGFRKNDLGGNLALRAHCVLLLDYVPPEEPLGTPLGNTLRTRRPKLDWRGP